MPRHITEYILYRWRYAIGYTLVGLLVAALLVVAALYVPGGLREAEMLAATNSSNLSLTALDPTDVIDLPFTVLQHISFLVFGITTLSIKLPSLLLGLGSLVGIILLLRHWFHMNVAVIAALIVITTSQFIFSSQDGTPTIMYVFMPTWLLLLALKMSRQTGKHNVWELLLVGAVALSLYTPLSIYVIVALVSATLLHPHLRYIVGRLSRRKILAAGAIGMALLSPLITAVLAKPEIGLTLLGIPQEWPDLRITTLELIETHLGFIFFRGDEHIQSAYTLPSLLLMILGVIHLFKTRHTARSYIISSWMLLLIPIILINPSKTTITFVPVMLLIAAGIDELLHRWYSMFPRNPYARIAGLFPMTLLVVGMALTGIERYFYMYRYNPPIVAEFSDDLRLLQAELTGRSDAVELYTTQAELPFYQAVASRSATLIIGEPGQALPDDGHFLITRSAFNERDMGDLEPSKILTNGRSNKADRFYLYN